MKIFFGTVILILFWCNNSFAGWTKVSEGAGVSNLTLYIDKKTIKKTADTVIYKQLNSYSTPVNEGIYSDIAYVKVNCTNSEARFLDTTYYSGKMGRGSVVAEDKSISDWDYFEPKSIMGIAIKYVCK